MNIIDIIKNMTVINWISISLPFVILIVGISLKLYYNKRLRDLDGVIGILQPDKEEHDDET